MEVETIIGTKWNMTQTAKDLADCIYEFLPNGILRHNSNLSKWDIKGDKIIISHNNGYAVLEGQIVNNILSGTASNKVGTKWTFKGELISNSQSLKNTINALILDGANENLDKLIEAVFSTIKDYRTDENNPLVHITPNRIRNWINQFDNNQKAPILVELDNIFKKRYCSKSKVKGFLDDVINVLTKDFGFTSPMEFLKNSDFLNLQPEGKSQRIMLSLFNDHIQEKYRLSLADCGTSSKKYSIYIDDILCTGLTLISDTKEWSEKEFSSGKTNKQAVSDGSTILVFAYVFIHEKNYHKKKAEMRFKISNEVSNNHKMYRMSEIENGIGQSSKIDLIYPLEDGQPQSVIAYKDEIIELVDNHTQQYDRTSPEEFYRPEGLPINEQFFTSPQNRVIVENAFLHKGIEILQNANPNNRNMRALGYSIPSLKNFGFGALCFTWRNVPNNAPLVFWYSGGGFTPLFKVTRGGNFFF
ncbi:hypothetical protein I5M27_11290 [Adhaeribacter sp. BT258]|uniref:PRTase-CE domain-containing protein n=1 Tax=Adhaeribacter terrigena TaxID=2793070 RepID=A0ABS1C2E3_9BACT|nr:hypothetical protein [Adhaeribacter terrigena]MBK0403573.1 hypothetical protein [Adhaeribacter terrigena]